MLSLYQTSVKLSIAVIIALFGASFLPFSYTANAQILPLLFGRQAPTPKPKTYTKDELKQKLAREIIQIEGDAKGDGKYEIENPKTKKRERIDVNMTEITGGMKDAQDSVFGRDLYNFLRNLLIQVQEELRLLKELYRKIDTFSEKEIDRRLAEISKKMTSIMSAIDAATGEMKRLEKKASESLFSDKDTAVKLRQKISQMQAKKAYLQNEIKNLNSIVAATIVVPPPPIKDQIKEQEELFKQLLEQAKRQMGGALVLNLFDEPGFWPRWFGGGQQNKPEDEQTLAKLKLINAQLQELVKNKILTADDIKKLEIAKTLEEKIKIIVDIQERDQKTTEEPPSKPRIPIKKSSAEELENMFKNGWPGEDSFNARKSLIEKQYKNNPEKLKEEMKKFYKNLIDIMPYNIKDKYLKEYDKIYNSETPILETPPKPQPKPILPEPEPKLKIKYIINSKDTLKKRAKLEELAREGKIEFQEVKISDPQKAPFGGVTWYIEGYTPEQVKVWVEKNILNK